MKLIESMLVYNPGTSEVRVVQWPDYTRAGWGYRYSFLACDRGFHDVSPATRTLLLFINVFQAIVRDGGDPIALHNALLEVDEYRRHIALDMQFPMEVTSPF